MKQYTLTEDQLKELLYWSHSYGRSMQFNYSLFGPDSEQAKPFSEDKAAEYCLTQAQKIIGN